MASLGELLAGGASTRNPPMPATKTDITGAPVQTPAEGGMQRMMADPRMQSFMLNMAANLLTSQGFGPSLAAGLEGMGRYEEGKRRRELEDADLALRTAAAARRGRGSGSQKSDSDKFYEKRDELFKMLGGEDLEPGSPEQTAVLAQATTMAMAQAGDREAFDLWSELTPEQKLAHGRSFTNPETITGLITGWRNTPEVSSPSENDVIIPGTDSAIATGPNTSPIAPPSVGSVPSTGSSPRPSETRNRLDSFNQNLRNMGRGGSGGRE